MSQTPSDKSRKMILLTILAIMLARVYQYTEIGRQGETGAF
jgi:hypothetical protein